MTLRVPQAKVHPARRLAGSFAPGTATANNGIIYAIVPVLGQASVSARIKTATQGGTIDIFFVGANFDPEQTAAYASLVGTIYTTSSPTQVAVSAGTEALITAPCLGECYAIIKFVGGGTGTITFCDVFTLPVSF